MMMMMMMMMMMISGRYGSSEGLSNSACSGDCDAGYYCPEASISPTQIPCAGLPNYLTIIEDFNNTVSMLNETERELLLESIAVPLVGIIPFPNSVFCPSGSSAPLKARIGYYTVGNNETTR
jgi:hypothetical protein